MTAATRSAKAAAAGKLGGLRRWATTTDRTAATAPARQAAEDRWLNKIREQYPDVDDRTAALMADAARKEHYVRMGRASAAARRARKAR